MFPLAASLTEENPPGQKGKVFIATGRTSGLGFELSNILYAHNATVYIAARSGNKVRKAIEDIKSKNPNSIGDEFPSREKRQDVQWNNAGVIMSLKGSKTDRGYWGRLGMNTLGPFLFTQYSMVQLLVPPSGVDMDNLDYKTEKGAMHKYAVSKAANTFHSTELARRHGGDGIIRVFRRIGNLALNPAIYGTHTELFAGLSPGVTADKNGSWIVSYGQFGALLEDIEKATRS
ncbi:retinol dehydrogenase 12 [Xylaria grammica]|nr:retinol dehydrogenase 12 [Xylaria grammica]